MRKYCFAIVSLLFLLTASFTLHKFYVSKTSIRWNERSQGFEITCRIFTDDLERALGDSDNHRIRLKDGEHDAEEETALKDYLNTHLHIRINDLPVSLSYVGFETEADLTWCYLEFYRPANFKTCTIENTLLFEIFPEQQNIVDLTVNSTTQTLVILKAQPVQTIIR